MEVESKYAVLDRVMTQAKRGSRDLRLLAFTAFSTMFGFGVFSAAYTNFAVHALNIKPMEIGYVESIRETPGFLIVLVAALTMRVTEPRLGSFSLCLMGAGMAAYYFVGGIPSLIIFSLVWSIGLHSWMTINPSMALSLSEKGNRGRRLGQLNSISTLGMILGMGLVLLIGKHIGFKNIFVLSGIAVTAGAAAVSQISKSIGHPEKPRMVFKWKYSLYYALTLLEGCRKQVFMTFAIFVLVRNYDTSMQAVAALMVINSLVTFFLSPRVGRLIDRIGEKRVLAFCYAALIPVFLGYALIKSREFLYVLYCLDSLFFLGSIGLNTYLHKIADSEDLMPTIAMGVSMNHTAAVSVPLIGGFLWARFGYPVAFLGGAVVVAISVILALRITAPAKPCS